MQSFVGSYLEQSLKLLSSQQQQIRGAMGSDAYETISTLTQKNLERWRSIQEDIFKAMSSGGSSTATRTKDLDDDPADDGRAKHV